MNLEELIKKGIEAMENADEKDANITSNLLIKFLREEARIEEKPIAAITAVLLKNRRLFLNLEEYPSFTDFYSIAAEYGFYPNELIKEGRFVVENHKLVKAMLITPRDVCMFFRYYEGFGKWVEREGTPEGWKLIDRILSLSAGILRAASKLAFKEKILEGAMFIYYELLYTYDRERFLFINENNEEKEKERVIYQELGAKELLKKRLKTS